ncbi:hypothetical protein [Neisseria polysaccharea]|uniref:hypothetical protein n=1 Tax=Neisseria polysaccharea TaxID=489 RepID=UPI0002E27896
MLVLYGNFIDFDVFGKKSEEAEAAEKLTIFVTPDNFCQFWTDNFRQTAGKSAPSFRTGGNPDLKAAAIFKNYLKV